MLVFRIASSAVVQKMGPGRKILMMRIYTPLNSMCILYKALKVLNLRIN